VHISKSNFGTMVDNGPFALLWRVEIASESRPLSRRQSSGLVPTYVLEQAVARNDLASFTPLVQSGLHLLPKRLIPCNPITMSRRMQEDSGRTYLFRDIMALETPMPVTQLPMTMPHLFLSAHSPIRLELSESRHRTSSSPTTLSSSTCPAPVLPSHPSMSKR
jgi:hypothetical protein